MHYSEKILVVSSSIKKRLLKKSITDKLSELVRSNEKILWDNVASEFTLNKSFSSKDLNQLRLQFRGANIDLNLIETNQKNNRRKKLLVADMDSTILSSETLDDLANLVGKKYEIEKITNDAMQGKINFVSSLLKRVKALSKTNTNHLDIINKSLTYNDGARELVSTMKSNGSICALCTGGFYYIADKVKTTLGFDHVQANTLEIKDGFITGKLLEPIFNEKSKLEFLEILIKKYKLNAKKTCAIGDGANDIEIIKKSSLGVSFKGKKILKENTRFILDHSDLTGLLFLQGYTKSEIK
tara:strand:- start:220 stop:1113 length:894 start_codon:yes stop_codon:yes gene_type:complete